MKETLHEQMRSEILHILHQGGSTTTMLDLVMNVLIAKLADSAAIDLTQDDGSILRALTRHRNLRHQVMLESYRQNFPLPITASYGYPRVIKTGKSQFIPGVTARISGHLYPPTEKGVEIKVHSFICVPLISQGRTLGALSVEMTDQNRSFSRDELLLLEEVASLIAQAIDRGEEKSSRIAFRPIA
ncbi:MAG TPA: GAF domain-containing protein [Candidatus Kapabacteria bacterium]